jgi:hypothetical protein
MLVSEQELRFDFRGARFDLSSPSDRKLLAWVFNQFLYGEVTGIQCGHWLYHAPHLNAATFLAKQAGEEMAHVRRFLRILSLLGEEPGPPHPVIRFLSTGMMGASWGEHVAIEMALGEGLVLGVFYAMEDTIPDPEIRKILESAAPEEQRHVEFGERETQAWLQANPSSRKLLLGLALLQLLAMGRLKRFVLGRLRAGATPGHPVLARFEEFYDHTLRCFGLRIERLGLSDRPLSALSALEKASLIAALPARKLRARLRRKPRLLTATYLRDPALLAESQRSRPAAQLE